MGYERTYYGSAKDHILFTSGRQIPSPELTRKPIESPLWRIVVLNPCAGQREAELCQAEMLAQETKC